ncbi:AraC family transcriptional regulator [Paenibacillus sp. J5C_2022]|uniref:AraC family transcriptional regulator n=1 Tax=Paenibacillus sp. J5C2022 TaxID=2977129 RepID=UPI0021CE65A1|nr:AraC family transcriptional regulator [Paenibacillus sp. J5C2022]MCU6711456.1 AraC family transcriptional regulator [Paenibacillus sp. J5C2022]
MRTGFRKHLQVTDRDKVLPLYVESTGYLPRQGPIRRKKGYPAYQWLQTVEGCGEFRYEAGSHLLHPGQGFLMPPHMPHSYESTGADWSILFVTFEGALAGHILSGLSLPYPYQYGIGQRERLEEALDAMVRKAMEEPQYGGTASTSDIYDFLVRLKQFGTPNASASAAAKRDRLIPLIQWLDERYSDPSLSLSDMSGHMHLTPQRLSALFQAAIGISPYAYLIGVRLQKAKDMLAAHSGMSVKEIAYATGYRDESHFVSAFRKQTGMTPNAFRRLYWR